MTRAKIKAAEAEARRFLERVKALRAVLDDGAEDDPIWDCPRQSGAVRRASLDLTRALAEMRRP